MTLFKHQVLANFRFKIRHLATAFLFFTILAAPLSAEEDQHPQITRSSTGNGAGYSTRDASVLSMMGWGIGLGAGIAVLCGMLEQDTAHSH